MDSTYQVYILTDPIKLYQSHNSTASYLLKAWWMNKWSERNPEQAEEGITQISYFNQELYMRTHDAQTHEHIDWRIFLNTVEQKVNEWTVWSPICWQLLWIYTVFNTYSYKFLPDFSLTWLIGRESKFLVLNFTQQLVSTKWCKGAHNSFIDLFMAMVWYAAGEIWVVLLWDDVSWAQSLFKTWSVFTLFMNKENNCGISAPTQMMKKRGRTRLYIGSAHCSGYVASFVY